MTRRVLTIVFSVLLVIGFAPVSAQDVAPPQDRPVGILAEFEVAELPTPHAEVWFVRMQLEPGGSIPEGPQIGPVVLFIEAGQLVIETDVAIEVAATGTVTTGATATPEGMELVTLAAGDSASVPAGAVMAARNDGSEPATFLVVMMYAAELEGTMTEGGEPVGLTQSLLSAGGVEFPPIPGTITIERIQLSQAEPSVTQNMAGIELGVVETGRADVTFTDFEPGTFIWRGITDAYPDREIVMMTGGTTMKAGDGYATASSLATWIVMEEPVVVLRVVAGPPIGR